ncbi:hypothetical protein VTJ49DRAFT_5580 [Mycothermus thermophilus]|uniref:Xylanolytic transcriptional activator regulatory domain-containing protein n=1 Tax=Humicola insolens TaxID=85995 RepID=A0ABR3VKG7_HUMIN
MAQTSATAEHALSTTTAAEEAKTTTTITTATAASLGYSHTGSSTLVFLRRLESTPCPSLTPTTRNDDVRHQEQHRHQQHNGDRKLDKEYGINPQIQEDTDRRNVTSHPRYRALLRQLPPRRAIECLADLYFRDFNWNYDVIDRDVWEAQLGRWYSSNTPNSTAAADAGCGSTGASSRGWTGVMRPDRLDDGERSQGGCGWDEKEMMALPAVIFGLCAVALTGLEDDGSSGDDGDENEGRVGGGEKAGKGGSKEERAILQELKYAGGMTFDDVSREYSEAGMEVLCVLGKRGMGLNTVLAGFLRACWLKYAGFVTESWHAIGSAIRDAQEIGLHRDSLDPRPRASTAEAVLENRWDIQRRRKTWMTLSLWDGHMACVLGRPALTPTSTCITTAASSSMPTSSSPALQSSRSLPVDAVPPPPPSPGNPNPRSRTPVVPRGDDDPPTPLTRWLWVARVLAPILQEVLALEPHGPCPPREYLARVDQLDAELRSLAGAGERAMPASLRIRLIDGPDGPRMDTADTDTRFDAHPGFRRWLPRARASLPQLVAFVRMALHRPYVFTRPASRREALRASLEMLGAERVYFGLLRPGLYKTFSVFYGSFDAIVLMASIYILFPHEHPELIPHALQHFHWAIERFDTVASRNRLVHAGRSVLHALHLRLRKALGVSASSLRSLPLSSPSSRTMATSESMNAPSDASGSASHPPNVHPWTNSRTAGGASGRSSQSQSNQDNKTSHRGHHTASRAITRSNLSITQIPTPNSTSSSSSNSSSIDSQFTTEHYAQIHARQNQESNVNHPDLAFSQPIVQGTTNTTKGSNISDTAAHDITNINGSNESPFDISGCGYSSVFQLHQHRKRGSEQHQLQYEDPRQDHNQAQYRQQQHQLGDMDVDWASLQPIYATGDLIYHDLVSTMPEQVETLDLGFDLGSAWEMDAGVKSSGGCRGGEEHQPGCQRQESSGHGSFGGGQHQAQRQRVISFDGQGRFDDQREAEADTIGLEAAAAAAVVGEYQHATFGVLSEEGCRFRGHFGDRSVWNVMNQHCPY